MAAPPDACTREQVDAELGGRCHGVGDGARDVVVLEVEEHALAAAAQRPHQAGPDA
jgi:hypothetical protein